jgi:hypothetical protein
MDNNNVNIVVIVAIKKLSPSSETIDNDPEIASLKLFNVGSKKIFGGYAKTSISLFNETKTDQINGKIHINIMKVAKVVNI